MYPLPALVALGGWLYIFYAAGASAIAYGLVSIAAARRVLAARGARARVAVRAQLLTGRLRSRNAGALRRPSGSTAIAATVACPPGASATCSGAA